jgi:hypothetical protein
MKYNEYMKINFDTLQNIPDSFSMKSEMEPKIPTKEEVRFEIKKHLEKVISEEKNDRLKMEEEPSTEVYDESGKLIVLSYIVREEGSGEYMEYNYVLAGRHKTAEAGRNDSKNSDIHLVYYNENGIPCKADGDPVHTFE